MPKPPQPKNLFESERRKRHKLRAHRSTDLPDSGAWLKGAATPASVSRTGFKTQRSSEGWKYTGRGWQQKRGVIMTTTRAETTNKVHN